MKNVIVFLEDIIRSTLPYGIERVLEKKTLGIDY
jgi:hypothetical protein